MVRLRGRLRQRLDDAFESFEDSFASLLQPAAKVRPIALDDLDGHRQEGGGAVRMTTVRSTNRSSS